MPSFIKIRPVGAELFHVDGPDDANSRFRIFANAPENSTLCPRSEFTCFVRNSEQTAIISVHSINWLVSITETECVYCAVRANSKYISGYVLDCKGLSTVLWRRVEKWSTATPQQMKICRQLHAQRALRPRKKLPVPTAWYLQPVWTLQRIDKFLPLPWIKLRYSGRKIRGLVTWNELGP